MNAEITAAIIAGIVGPIVTFVAIKLYEQRYWAVLPEGRRRVLAGTWEGNAHQDIGPEGTPLDFVIRLELSPARRTVKGTARFLAVRIRGEEYQADFNVSGGFLHQRFLTLDYKNSDDSALQFGSMTYEMSADGRCLRGRYLGYGAVSERLVYGTVELKKKA